MKTLMLAAIRCSLIFTAVTASLFSVQPVHATYTATLQQVGSNVIGTGSGSLDFTSLFLEFSGVGSVPNVDAFNSGLILGPTPFALVNVFRGISGPTNFGSGGAHFADSGAGNVAGVNGSTPGLQRLFVPVGYVSGTALGTTIDIWSNATFASLGVTPGSYVWIWGSGAHADSFTLVIGGAGVPDGGSTVSLLSCALLGFAALRRKLSC